MRKLVVYLGLLFCLGVVSGGEDLEAIKEKVKEAKALLQSAIEELNHLYETTHDDTYILEEAKVLVDIGQYESAEKVLSGCGKEECKKLLARVYYHLGRYTDAVSLWERLDLDEDWESRYLFALACEKLNLFPQARRQLRMIPRDSKFYSLGQEELKRIEEGMGESASGLFSPELWQRIESATAEKFPEAGSVVIFERYTTEVTKDKKVRQRWHVLRKILNDRGKEEFGEVVIPYDSTYETVRLVFARTITPDRRVVKVGKKHIRDVSLYKNFPLYSNARATIVSMPEVVPGSLIEYEVELTDNKMLADEHLVYYISPQGREPVLEYEDVLKVPASLHLRYRDINSGHEPLKGSFSPEVRREGDSLVMTWRFEDVPQVIPEPSMPSLINVVPVRIYSSFASWDQIYRWWWALAKDKIKATKAIKEKVAELVEGTASEEEKARRIYHYCAKEIRYVAVEYGKAGYEPHSAEEIFSNKYGDCKDQSILLITMLRSAGLEAYPVIIPTRDLPDVDKSFPVVLFNHAIAVVKLDRKWVFMDPTASTCGFGDLPPSDQDRGVLIYTENGLKLSRTPLFPPEHNRIEILTKIDRQEDGDLVVADRRVVATGAFASGQRYWLEYTMPELIRQQLETKAKSILPSARVVDYQVKDLEKPDRPVVLEYRFKGEGEVVLRAGDYRILPSFVGVDLSDVILPQRRYPLEKMAPYHRQDVYQFLFGRPVRAVFLPEKVVKDTPWFRCEVQYEFRPKDKGAVVEERIDYVLKTRTIAPEDYPRYKEEKESLSRMLRQRLLLKLE